MFKRLLTELEWGTVLDFCEEKIAEGWEVRDVGEHLGNVRGRWGLMRADVEALEGRLRERWRERVAEEGDLERAQKRDVGGEAGPGSGLGMGTGIGTSANVGGSGSESGGGGSDSGVRAQLMDALALILGVGVKAMKIVWRKGPCRVLREGDAAEMLWGAGRDWMVCAVRIRRADGREEVLPEHRIRARGKRACGRYKGARLHLLKMDLEVQGHSPEVMMRRLAAWSFTYMGIRCGVRDMVELARLNGTSKQAVHQQIGVIREKHAARTGERLEKVRIGGAVPGRGRRAGGAR